MAMTVTTLSSNWKSLQKTLKKNEASSGTSQPKSLLKRKALTELHAKPKRTRTTSNSTDTLHNRKTKPSRSLSEPSKRKMGGYLSSSVVEEPVETPPEPKTAQRPVRAGKYVAIDCEMVGTTSLTPFSIPSRNVEGEYSILARVSIVSYSLDVLYDTYVLPPPDVRITDYRTQWSGITPWHLTPSNPATLPRKFEAVQREVAAIMDGRILVGHSVSNDLDVLGLSHPRHNIRDTAHYPPFRAMVSAPGKNGRPGKGRTPGLKRLTKEVLGRDIQDDDGKGHNSVEDAKATMELFVKEKRGFETEVIKTFGRPSIVKANVNAVLKRDGQGTDDIALDDAAEDSNVDEDGEGSAKSSKKRKKKKKKKGKYKH